MSALGRWMPEGWQQRWMDLSGRERAGLSVALGLLALALVWSVGVTPAWRQWQQGQVQTQALQTQWQGMQALQAQVSALKGQSRLRPEEATRLLQASVGTLGPGASLVVNGDLATVQIKGASPAALSQWLAQARVQAQALPVQARLGRSAANAAAGPTGAQGAAPSAPAAPALTPGPNPGNGTVLWEGQIVLQLPTPAKP